MSDSQIHQTPENLQLYTLNIVESFITKRSSRYIRRQSADDSTISTPTAETIISGQRHLLTRHSTGSVSPQITRGRITWKNTPKQPIPQLDDVDQWIGHQLNHRRMPDKYMDTPPHGLLITQVNGYPDGLLVIPGKNGSPRIIVPKFQVEGLVLQCHEDIHHQSHVKVIHWPGMAVGRSKKDTYGMSNVPDRLRSTQAPQNKIRSARITINGNATTGLWDRLLWSILQGRDHGHRRIIHERNHPDSS
jgi:hypothetical protein